MFNVIEPYSGHVIKAKYLEFNENDKIYKPPIDIKLKGNASIGVSTGIKEQIQVQDIAGRWVLRDSFRVHTVDRHNYKPKDKIIVEYENKTYIILRVSDDITHPNNLKGVMFRGISVPKVLYLGEN